MSPNALQKMNSPFLQAQAQHIPLTPNENVGALDSQARAGLNSVDNPRKKGMLSHILLRKASGHSPDMFGFATADDPEQADFDKKFNYDSAIRHKFGKILNTVDKERVIQEKSDLADSMGVSDANNDLGGSNARADSQRGKGSARKNTAHAKSTFYSFKRGGYQSRPNSPDANRREQPARDSRVDSPEAAGGHDRRRLQIKTLLIPKALNPGSKAGPKWLQPERGPNRVNLWAENRSLQVSRRHNHAVPRKFPAKKSSQLRTLSKRPLQMSFRRAGADAARPGKSLTSKPFKVVSRRVQPKSSQSLGKSLAKPVSLREKIRLKLSQNSRLVSKRRPG